MSHVFLDVLVVLVAAKLAAEVAERLGVPAVVGEILAGVAVGPSALGLVETTEVLRVLGEIGVILLLLEVGMHMDLHELRAVGRASLSVAAVGVAAALVGGTAVGALFDLPTEQAVFVAAAISATSIGITARVFGDLRALASTEARTVLGAAIADDVLGLVLLTVVVRVVTGDGDVGIAGVSGIVAVAIGFLVLASLAGGAFAPHLFAGIDRVARSNGTLLALALAFTLAVAELATAAKLAPIVGAFVAGLALGRTEPAQRIQRELTPIGHLFVPVFFLQIGIDTDVDLLARRSVLGLAAALTAVAVGSKLLAGLGVLGRPGDTLLVGLGMIPRGEVTLIFAGVGLREHVLGDDVYAALLLTVLATTLLTPPLLRRRLLRARTADASRPGASTGGGPVERPPGGWLATEAGPGGGARVVDLAARPGPEDALAVAFDAAVLVDGHAPGEGLLAWLRDSTGRSPGGHRAAGAAALPWNHGAVESFLAVLERGSVRSWRFLETTGVLDVALPEVAADLRRRRLDPTVVDPDGLLRWRLLDRIHALVEGRVEQVGDEALCEEAAQLQHRARVHLAALLVEATAAEPAPALVARSLLDRLVLDEAANAAVAVLVSDRGLLRAAAARADGLGQESVLRIATHLATREQVRAMYLLTAAQDDLTTVERDRLDELLRLVLAGLAHSDLVEADTVSLIDRKRAEAIELAPARSAVADRIALAPLGYLVMEDPAAIVRQTSLIEPIPTRGRFRVTVSDEPDGRWRVEVGGRDQLGLLAVVTRILEEARLDVDDAVIATWGDGGALQAFRVRPDAPGARPDPEAIVAALLGTWHRELTAAPVTDAIVSFDDVASPWHTIAEVRATDRRGLLHALAVAFAAAGADVHAAHVSTADEMVLDRFDLTDRNGRKLDDMTKASIRRALRYGVAPRGRRPWRTSRVGTIRRPVGG